MIGALLFAATISMSLDDALTTTLQRSIPYQLAQAQTRQASVALTAAHAQWYPTIDVRESRQTQSQGSIPSFTFPYPEPNGAFRMETLTLASPATTQFGADAHWEFYRGGGITASIGEATAQYTGSLQSLVAVRNDALTQTTQDYFTLAAAQRDVQIAQNANRVAHQNTQVALQRFRAGVAPRADVLREQLSEANAQTDLVDAQNVAANANAVLVHDLDLASGTLIAPTEPLDRTLPQAGDPSALVARAQRQRPELRAAESSVDAAGYAIRVARSSALPTVAFDASDSNTRPAILGASQPQLVTTLSATWRIFDGNLTRGEVEAASAQYDQATLELQQLRNDVDLDVQRAYDDYTAAIARVASAASAQIFSEENLRITQLRFRNGVATALELSDALLADSQARTGYVDAQARARIALAALARAVGDR